MSVVTPAVRAAIETPAGHGCEYCHLPMRGQVAPFPIDHVIPRTLAGPTAMEKLALACPVCNGCKWKYHVGEDPETGAVVPLFNPRTGI